MEIRISNIYLKYTHYSTYPITLEALYNTNTSLQISVQHAKRTNIIKMSLIAIAKQHHAPLIYCALTRTQFKAVAMSLHHINAVHTHLPPLQD